MGLVGVSARADQHTQRFRVAILSRNVDRRETVLRKEKRKARMRCSEKKKGGVLSLSFLFSLRTLNVTAAVIPFPRNQGLEKNDNNNIKK